MKATINNSKLANDGGVTSSDNTDLFGMQLLYDQTDSNLGNTPYFNGKLSAVKWMSKDAGNNSSYERAYKYSYDGINRYTGSAYAERTPTGTGAFNNNTGGFDESGITYDLNGNILALQRNSSTQGTNTHIQIDNLTYAYDAVNPNQLKTVTDGTGTNYTSAGFRNYTGSTDSYTYDTNGNLTADPYKGLALAYDVLNRTDKITVTTSTGRFINYTYDASGSLIEKQQYDNNTIQTTTDYVDGFVYVNKTLSYFPMPEGRVVNSGGTMSQEFVITDQQGNARISFNNSGTDGTPKVIQENSYYGYGFTLLNSPVALPTTPNKQLYNGGSEWQNDYSNLPDYYQTFNRNYDAATGRFIGVDPAAESAESLTSYQYAGNNPVIYNDPLGDLKHQDPPNLQAFFNGLVNSQRTPDNGVGSVESWLDQQEAIAAGGLYAIDPGLANSIALSMNGSVYNAGDKTTNQPSTGSLSSALATIQKLTGQTPGSSYSASLAAALDAALPPNPSFPGIMLPEVNINAFHTSNLPSWFGNGNYFLNNANQGGNIQLLGGGVKNGVFDATFFVGATPASGLQMIQIASYTRNGVSHKLIDGSQPNGKPYYYYKGELINGNRPFSSWTNSAGQIITHDAPDGMGVNTIYFETIIVAVNYNNTNSDRILGAFNWVWTPSANSSINLNTAASPGAIRFIQGAYPSYNIK